MFFFLSILVDAINNHTAETSGSCIFWLARPGSALQMKTNHGQERHTKALSSAQLLQAYNMSAVLFLQGHIRKSNGYASAPQGHSSGADPEQTHSCLLRLASARYKPLIPKLLFTPTVAFQAFYF